MSLFHCACLQFVMRDACVRSYEHVCVCACVRACVCLCMCVCVWHVCVYTCASMHRQFVCYHKLPMHASTRVHTDVPHTRTHTHARTHTRTHTCSYERTHACTHHASQIAITNMHAYTHATRCLLSMCTLLRAVCVLASSACERLCVCVHELHDHVRVCACA